MFWLVDSLLSDATRPPAVAVVLAAFAAASATNSSLCHRADLRATGIRSLTRASSMLKATLLCYKT